jgi:hypothetical protein
MNKYKQIFQVYNVDFFSLAIGREKNQLFNIILSFLKHSIIFWYFHLPQDKSTNRNYMFTTYEHTLNKDSTQLLPQKP